MKSTHTFSVFFLTCVSVSALHAQQTIWPSQVLPQTPATQQEQESIWPTAWDSSNPNTPYYYYPPEDKALTGDVKYSNQATTEAPYSDKWEYYCYPTYVYPMQNRGNYAYQQQQMMYRNAYQQQQINPAQAAMMTQSRPRPYPNQFTAQATSVPTAPNPAIESFAQLQVLQKQHTELLVESSKTMEIQAAAITQLSDSLKATLKQAEMDKKQLQSQLDKALAELQKKQAASSQKNTELEQCTNQFTADTQQYKQNISQLEQQLTQQSQQYESANAELMATQQTKQTQLAQHYSTFIKQLEMQMQALIDENTQTQQGLLTSQSYLDQRDYCRSDLNKEKQSTGALRQQLNSLTKRYKTLQHSLQQQTQQKVSSAHTLQDTQQQLLTLQQQAEQKQTALATAKQDHDKLQLCLRDSQQAKQNYSESLTSVEQKFTNLQTEHEKTKSAFLIAMQDDDTDGVINKTDRCPDSAKDALVDKTGCTIIADADKDGIPDQQDQCQHSTAGIKVNSKGCEVDADQDGVADSQDKCPDSKKAEKVDNTGCVLLDDDDSDGINNKKDLCLQSQATENVNAVGCPDGKNISLTGVTFKVGSNQLTPASLPILDQASAVLTQHSDLKIEVSGYTDNMGNVAKNKRLSQQRADAVLTYLVSKGVEAAMLSAKGYGIESPIANNATAEGRALNRRVELKLLSATTTQ